jgi:hypothetical protein
LTHFLNDEQEINFRMPGEWDRRDVRDDGDNITIKAIQKLLELVLILCHFEIETVNAVFHFYLQFAATDYSIVYL